MHRYYGVIRSKQYLMHYGIKGMKWGVRRALEKGNDRALKYHYLRAKMKLNKLNRESNWYLHDIKGDLWGKFQDNHRVLGTLMGAGLRSKIHYLKSSDAGDLMMDKRRDKFKEAMDDAFRGTKYDTKRLERQKAQRRKRLLAKIGIKPKPKI